MLRIEREYKENKKVEVEIFEDFTLTLEGEGNENFTKFNAALIGMGMAVVKCKEMLKEGKVEDVLKELEKANERIKKATSEE